MNHFFAQIARFFRNLFGTEADNQAVIEISPTKRPENLDKHESPQTPRAETIVEIPAKEEEPLTLPPNSSPVVSQPHLPPVPDTHTEETEAALTVQIERYGFTLYETIGVLRINGKEYAKTLEDVHPSKGVSMLQLFGPDKGVYKYNCIPAGSYALSLRKQGGMHDSYSLRLGTAHKGMLEVVVPNQPYIFLISGGDVHDTRGKIVIGRTLILKEKSLNKDEKILLQTFTDSDETYDEVYPLIADYLEKGGKVRLNVVEKTS